MDNNRKQQIDDFILFLEENKFDTGNVESFIRKFKIKFFFKKIFGFLLIILALALIVIPIPSSLEIATLFYFNNQDGITVSDIVALSLLLFGIILILKDKIYYGSVIE